MSNFVTAADGTALDLDSLAQSLGYNASGQLTSISVSHVNGVYVKTLSYNAAGQLTGVSQWVKQ